MYLVERKEATYENLRDLNFEFKAGKLSEQDYAIQRASLEDEAAAILAELESIEKAKAVVRQGTRRTARRTEGGLEEVCAVQLTRVRQSRAFRSAGNDSLIICSALLKSLRELKPLIFTVAEAVGQL